MGVEILDHADQPSVPTIRSRGRWPANARFGLDSQARALASCPPTMASRLRNRRIHSSAASYSFVPSSRPRSRLMRRDSVEGSTPMMRARWAWLTPSNSAAFMAASSTTCPVDPYVGVAA